MTTFILFLLGIHLSFAKELEELSKFSVEQEKCIQQVLKHPFTKQMFPGLLDQHQYSNDNFSFLKNLVGFCQCRSQGLVSQKALKHKDPISYSFRDKANSLEVHDDCAQDQFQTVGIQLYYTIVVADNLKLEIEDRLKKRMAPGTRLVAPSRTIASQMSCQERALLEKCTKVKNLRQTYRCIQRSISNPQWMRQLDKKCPMEEADFLADGNDQFI